MEITFQSPSSVKIRGKRSAIAINPQEKTSAYNAGLLVGHPAPSSLKIREDALIINGPGEYETGGIKISGLQNGAETVYSIRVDDVEILLGRLADLEKMHQKLKEHHIILLYANDDVKDASFVSGLATHAVMFYGEQAEAIGKALAKEALVEMNKYQATADKLPAEVQTILLK